jgi:hypothetical protein
MDVVMELPALHYDDAVVMASSVTIRCGSG